MNLASPPFIQRLGVYGGAFDPPHLAHTQLAQAAVADGYTAFKSMAVPSTMPIEGQKPVRAGSKHQITLRTTLVPSENGVSTGTLLLNSWSMLQELPQSCTALLNVVQSSLT